MSAVYRIPCRSNALPYAVVLMLALLNLNAPAFGEALPPAKSPAYDMPVSVARNGIPANLAYLMRQGFSSTNAYYTGDQNLYYFLHWEEFVPHNLIRRAGPSKTLDASPDDAIGEVRAESSLGEMSLDELIADPRARIQGFVVVHKGEILYERYPGMREDDHHLWFSVSKTVAGLLIGLLESEGRIDVRKPVEYYLPELASTHWEGVPIIDILDMASGLDVEENEESRTSPSSAVNHFFRIELGDTSGLGQRTSDQILFSAGDKRPSGEAFEYSSLNTKMLGLVVERVTGQRLADVFSERVWSKIGAEGDAQVGINLQGGAAVYGMISSRLRDMARYGMIYTPGWKAVSGERVVPQSLMDKIRNGCRPEIYRQGATARGRYDPDGGIRCNSRQWDAIFVDGDMYKGGARGQGLYVSPDRDLVVVWFSTDLGEWLDELRACHRDNPGAESMTVDTKSRIPSASWLIGCAASCRTAAFLLCCVAAAVCRPALADAARDRAAIIEAMQGWEQAVEARDYETLENFYTEDAIFYPNNAQPVVGRAAILERNRQRGSDGVVEIGQQVDDISINGNWAVYSCVASIEVSTPGTQESSVRYARVLLVMEKDEAGRWRIHRDIDNDPPEQPETE